MNIPADVIVHTCPEVPVAEKACVGAKLVVSS